MTARAPRHDEERIDPPGARERDDVHGDLRPGECDAGVADGQRTALVVGERIGCVGGLRPAAREQDERGATRAQKPHRASPRRPPRRRRRDPRRRPAAAAACRSGRRCGRGRGRVSTSAASSWPLPRTMYPASRGTSRARTRVGAMKSMPSSNRASGATRSGTEPAYEYGFRSSRRGRTPHGRRPRSRADGSQRPRRSTSIFVTSRTNATSPGRAPSAPRPSSSSRRTASASNPRPAEKQKRRPLTEPSEMRRDAVVAERGADRPRGGDRVARQPERAREDARASARQEAERDAPSAPFSASL